MARALALAVPIPPDAIDSFRALGELGARLGGEYQLAADIIATRLDARPEARAARRADAVAALASLCEPGSGRAIAREVAKKIRRYSATRWLRERAMQAAPLVGGEEGAMLFTIMQSGGAIGFDAIRKLLANAGNSVAFGSHLSITHANPQNTNHNEESVA